MSKKNKKKWGSSSSPGPDDPIWAGGPALRWETLTTEEGPVYTQRARLPGHDGWLYRCIGVWMQAHGGNMVAMAYVPPYGEPPDWGWGSK